MGKATRRKGTGKTTHHTRVDTTTATHSNSYLSTLLWIITFPYHRRELFICLVLVLLGGGYFLQRRERGCNSFTLITGNLTEANTVYFAAKPSLRQDVSICINQITTTRGIDKHTVLVQEAPQDLTIDCEVVGITNGTCKGWSDHNYLNELKLLHNDAIDTAMFREVWEYYIVNGGPKCDAYVKELIKAHTIARDNISSTYNFTPDNYKNKTSKIFNNAELQYINELVIINALEKISSARDEGKTYQTIANENKASKPTNPPYHQDQKKLDSIMGQQHRAMRETLKKQKGSRFVAVVGEPTYFTGKPGHDLHEKLKDYLDENPYAVLANFD